MKVNDRTGGKEDRRVTDDGKKVLRGMCGAMVVELVSILAYATRPGSSNFVSSASIGMMLGGASALIGIMLGFLFGIPRALQREAQAVATTAEPGDGAVSQPATDYRVNTNLEEISDWLTKILVGVGLTQVREISDRLVSLTKYAASGLGSAAQDEVFTGGLLSYSAVLGFLFGYLSTRLYLPGAFRWADQLGNLRAEVKQAAAKADSTRKLLDEIQQQAERDAKALSLIYHQLNPVAQLPALAQQELDAAVRGASRQIRVQIFYQAWEQRKANREHDKPKMELTIPLFRALIAADEEERYHMNHGELGFALKDKASPDWREAEAELTKAIQIRERENEGNWQLYEFNRAFCRIKLEPTDQKSDLARRSQILSDLRTLFRSPEMRRIVKTDNVVKDWMALNEITEGDLSGN